MSGEAERITSSEHADAMVGVAALIAQRDRYRTAHAKLEDRLHALAARLQAAEERAETYRIRSRKQQERAEQAERERDELKLLCHDADAETMLYVARLQASDDALRWVAENHPRVIREMPTAVFQRLRLAARQTE